MGRIYRSANIKVYISSFFKQQTTYQRSTISLKAPMFVMLIFAKIIFGIFKHFIYSDNTFGNKVNAFKLSGGRYFGIKKTKAGTKSFAQIFCSNGRGCTAADDMLSFL